VPQLASTDPGQLDGLSGWIAGVIDSLGAAGVFLLTALENLVPPVPSELVLPMAGYLAGAGRLNVVLVIAAATLGSACGALVLYGLGRRIGEARLRRWLDKVPFVDVEDLEKADRWFDKHGRAAVLFGRMVPVVRSLVSVPAGAHRMPVGQFLLYTMLGSGIWNALFVGAGFVLGEQWQQVDRYSRWFDYAIAIGFGGTVGWWIVRKLRQRSKSPA
jgi:membrane protein DedA with SNARE-associated domain